MVVVFVYVFAPVKIIVPVPALVNPPLPLMTAALVVARLLPPAVSEPLPSVTVPAAVVASEPMVSLNPFRSNDALLAVMSTGVRSESRSFAPSRNVPALRVVVLV